MTLIVEVDTIYLALEKKDYAIVEISGKQYKIAPGQVVDVDYLGLAEGTTLELDKVLFISSSGAVTIGNPFIEKAKVIASVLGDKKGDKVIVFKYKPKVRYRRKKGHRQSYTRLEIKELIESGRG